MSANHYCPGKNHLKLKHFDSHFEHFERGSSNKRLDNSLDYLYIGRHSTPWQKGDVSWP